MLVAGFDSPYPYDTNTSSLFRCIASDKRKFLCRPAAGRAPRSPTPIPCLPSTLVLAMLETAAAQTTSRTAPASTLRD